MSAEQFYTKFASLMLTNPPHKDDGVFLQRMSKLGFKAGETLNWQALPAESQQALSAAVAPALQAIKQSWRDSGEVANGWKTNLKGIGVYGTDYIHRAGVAYGGLGANAPVDAVYPTVFTDSNNKQLNAANKYRVHFAKDKLPPVKAFWSLTMYDERQLFTENTLNRFAIGDRDKLQFNPDGSLDLYIQAQSPGKDKESNWLAMPKSGDFSMNMRLYWPEQSVLDGSWAPPAVERVQ